MQVNGIPYSSLEDAYGMAPEEIAYHMRPPPFQKVQQMAEELKRYKEMVMRGPNTQQKVTTQQESSCNKFYAICAVVIGAIIIVLLFAILLRLSYIPYFSP